VPGPENAPLEQGEGVNNRVGMHSSV
jgi:hypothetical protein